MNKNLFNVINEDGTPVNAEALIKFNLNGNDYLVYTYNEIRKIKDKSDRFIYFGDEIYNGNDFDIAHSCNDFIEISLQKLCKNMVFKSF